MFDNKRKETLDEKNKKIRKKWDNLHFDSQQGRAGEDPYPTAVGSLRTPLYATKSYAYSSLTELLKNHYNYSRTENPTLYALDQKLATLHGGGSCPFSMFKHITTACRKNKTKKNKSFTSSK